MMMKVGNDGSQVLEALNCLFEARIIIGISWVNTEFKAWQIKK